MSGDAAKNVYAVSAFASWYDEVKGIKEMKKISLKYYPDMKPPNRYYIKGWISSKIISEGIRRAGSNLSPDRLVSSLEKIDSLDMKGLTGPISYSRNKHKGNNYARLYKADIKKGYFVAVSNWISSR